MYLTLLRPLPLIAAALALVAPSVMSAAAIPDSLFPLPDKVREIMNQRCVMCHGEVYDGKAEIREDLNLSTDAAIKETLSEAGRLKEVLVKNQMPQKAKLSFRLRKDPKQKERLETIKAEYDKNGEKEVLLAWLKDVVATETPEKKKKE
jgi:hypothetical protein